MTLSETGLALLGAFYKLLLITSISSRGVDIEVALQDGGIKNNGALKAVTFPPILRDSEGGATLGIVGGYPGGKGQLPYVVSLRNQQGQHFCGGSIISNNWILTSAQCLAGKLLSDITVHVGTIYLNEKGISYPALRVFSHEEFNPWTLINDIAVLEIDGRMTFTDIVNSTKMEFNRLSTIPPTTAILSGWGLTSYPGKLSNRLQYIQLQTIPVLDCQRKLPKHPVDSLGNICTFTQAGQGACQGDLGGPLVDTTTHRQVGIASWSSTPCAVGKPDVFTSVPNFHIWIGLKTNIWQ